MWAPVAIRVLEVLLSTVPVFVSGTRALSVCFAMRTEVNSESITPSSVCFGILWFWGQVWKLSSSPDSAISGIALRLEEREEGMGCGESCQLYQSFQ